MNNQTLIQHKDPTPAVINNRAQFNEIIKSNNFSINVERELTFVIEQVRMSHNKMAEYGKETSSLSAVVPSTMVSCVEYGLELGLSFNPIRNFLHLIPRWSKGSMAIECTLMVGYRGYKKLAANSGVFGNIRTELVRQNDEFQIIDDDKIHHVVHSLSDAERGDIKGGYCVANFKEPIDGSTAIITKMGIEDLTAIEASAKGTGYSPWVGPFKSQMYKKSIVRRAWSDWEYIIEESLGSSKLMNRMTALHEQEDNFSQEVPTSNTEKLLSGVQ